MLQLTLFSIAAVILTALAAIHSYLGEKYLFARLFAMAELPLFRKDRKYTENVIRFAWHITGASWIGLGGLLLLAAFGRTDLTAVSIGGIVAFHGIAILATCGRRHPAWMLFLLTSILIFAGTYYG